MVKRSENNTRIFFATRLLKRSPNHLMKHITFCTTKRSMKHLRMSLQKCLAIFLSTASLTACFHEALNHDCPPHHERGSNYICRPTSDPLVDAPAEETPVDDQPWTRDNPVKTTCPENPALAQFHEVLIDPEGPDQRREWIELSIARGGVLDGLYIDLRDTLLDEPSMRIELRGEVIDDQLILVADNQPESIAFGCDTHGGCLRNTGGVIELYDCNDEMIDSIAWGYATADGLASASGYSLSWCEQEDTWAQSTPTPNASEIEWRDPAQCAAPCKPPERLLFNEVLYDLIGPDGGSEFIELIGEPNTQLSNITLWTVNGYNGEPFLRPIEIEGTTDDDGFYLIGGEDIDGRDQTLPAQLQNGPEALYLEACDETWLDAMTYGGFTEHLAPYGDASPVIAPGLSLGRFPDGATPTGTMADFVGMPPTPRMSNDVADPP